MKGHIRERSPGRWAIVIDVKDNATGERKRKWRSFAGTKRQAQVECARLIADASRGTSIDPSKATIREYLLRWLDHMATQVSPRSAENYREFVEWYLIPALGSVPMTKLRPEQIAKAYADALTGGRRLGTGGLAPATVLAMHRTLKQALKQAVIWGLLLTNPAGACRPPRVERREMKVLDMANTAALIEHVQDKALHIPVLLLATCGLRGGEVAAIRWNRMNLDSAVLSISTSIEVTRAGLREKPPKSGRARTVVLPALVIEELRRHRLRQAEQLLRLGVRQSEQTHVCLLEDGSPWSPGLLSDRFRRMIRSSGLPVVRMHDLRHGHATHLLVSGVHPKVVQERLGHASIQLTLDTYSHVLPSMQGDAAAAIDGAMRAAMKRKR